MKSAGTSKQAGTPEAFYRLFQTLPHKERITAARYILEDEEVRHHFKLPNKSTLAAFSEKKEAMPLFSSVDALREDVMK